MTKPRRRFTDEFKRSTMGESKESYRVETYGKVVGITRRWFDADGCVPSAG